MKKIEEKISYNSIFQNLVNKNNIKHYTRNRSLGAVFAETFNRTNRDLLKRPLFEKFEINWIDVLSVIAKLKINRVHTYTRLTPIQASLKKNEGFVYQKVLDKRKKIKPKFQVNEFVRTADIEKTFSKSNSTSYSLKLYKFTEVFNDTIPSYRIDKLSEGYNEALLKKTNLTLKEKKMLRKNQT